MKFEIEEVSGESRIGRLETIHGTINTPAFMPVGTRASVKAISPCDVKKSGADIILGNTYHLMLRPGGDLIESAGGLRKFMNWEGPILTDSGGFQVMSLSGLRKISEEGVSFSSHIDGKKYILSPELSTKLQHQFDSTITMIFDECPPYPSSYEYTKQSMELSNRWAKRSRESFVLRDGYGQFGIMQGGVFRDLREISADFLVNLDFEGYAIGGLAVGEGQEVMFNVLDYATSLLPKDKPRYLMGVGKPSDIIGAVKRGVDMFDCVLPTRSARNGQAFTSHGAINIRNSKFKSDFSTLDENCDCIVCTKYSLAYLHHLFKVKEMFGPMLLTQHNLRYYQLLMKKIRNYIENNRELDFEY